MQRRSKKTLHLSKQLGLTIKNLRMDKNLSCTKLAYQFDIDKGNLNRIENGVIDCKFTTLWKISEALGLKLSELINILENNLDSSFTLGDE